MKIFELMDSLCILLACEDYLELLVLIIIASIFLGLSIPVEIVIDKIYTFCILIAKVCIEIPIILWNAWLKFSRKWERITLIFASYSEKLKYKTSL